jgi:hypothetical protein
MPIVQLRIENLKQVQEEMRAIASDQLPYATALALTKTAQAGQRNIRDTVLPSRFVLRRASWMKANIKIDPATKANLVAAVRDTFGAMALQETGGAKIPYGSAIAVPLRGARPSPASLISPQNMPSAIMARGGFINGNIMYDVTVKAGRRRAVKGAFGVSSSASWSRQIIPMYALVPRANVPARYGFEAAVEEIVRTTFGDNFREAFKRAVRTAR